MASKTRPATVEFTCDLCGVGLTQQSVYRPSHWGRLKLEMDAHDFQGQAVAKADVERDFCSGCLTRVVELLNKLKD